MTKGWAAKDVTVEQLEAANEFLDLVCVDAKGLSPDDAVMLNADALVILLAWYGALRFQDAASGTGTLEQPGTFMPAGGVSRLH